MERTIVVSGKANLNIEPDLIRMSLLLTNKLEKYEEAINEVSVLTSQLKDILVNLGICRNDIKTHIFSVEPYYQNKDNNYVLSGYKYRNELIFKFKKDKKLLSDIVNEVALSNINPFINISYELSNKDKIKDKLIALAVKKAKSEAKTIAKAANVALGEIIKINHVTANLDFGVNTLRSEGVSALSKSINLDIEAENINIKDEVEVVFLIK